MLTGVVLMIRWRRTLYITVFGQFVSALGFSIIFPFLPLYVEQLGTHTLSVEFWAGMVYSAQALTMAVTAPIWGGLANRYGRKLMVERAMFGSAITMLLMAFAGSGEVLTLLRAAQGAVSGVISAASALIASVTPRDRTGYAIGLLQMGMWGGISVGPLVGGFIADTFGYQATFVVTAVLLALAGLLVWRSVEENFQPVTAVRSRQHGLTGEWRRILAAPGVALVYGLRLVNALGQSMLAPIAPLFIQALMPSGAHVATTTGLMTGLSSAAGVFSAVYLGRLGDRVGHRRVLTASALVAAIFYLPQPFVAEAWQLLALQVFTGAAIGGLTPTLSALLAGYTEPGEEGVVYGLDNSIVAGGRAIAPLLAGVIAAAFGYRGTLGAIALVFFGVAVLAFRRLPKRRPALQAQRAEA